MIQPADARKTTPPVIIWAPVGKDGLLATASLREMGIASGSAAELEEVCAVVAREETGLLVVAEEALTPSAIDRLKHALEGQPPWSDLPILLLTSGGTSTEASLHRLRRMRALGNITLLERPFRRVTLTAAVQSGLASRHRQFQARDHIIALQEAHRELAQANADLKQFAFAASHDLQEPLRMINVFTDLLLTRYLDPSNTEAKQFGDYVRTGVRRMEALLRDLLLYSRVIHEDSEWSGIVCDLTRAVEDAQTTLQLDLNRTGGQVVCGRLQKVHGNTTQLSIVFQNLLSNSLKYCREGIPPIIKITCEPRGSECLVRVQDNGIGFEQKYAERVFDLFQRLGGHDAAGSGLGLAICRRIVERHGGRMWAESEPGKGAAFLFTLPLVTGTNPEVGKSTIGGT